MTVLARNLSQATGLFPRRIAFAHGDRTLSYEATETIVEEVAAGLARRGVEPGQLVALVLPSGLELAVLYLAIARLGAATSALRPRLTAEERTRVLARARPDHVIAVPQLSEGLQGHQVLHIAVGSEPAQMLQAIRHHTGCPRLAAYDPSTVETVVFTAGATGLPKGAVFTSAQIAANMDIEGPGTWGRGNAQVVATSMAHVDFMTKLAGHLKHGSTMHLLTHWRAPDALRLISEHEVPHVRGIATQISLMLHCPEFDSLDLSHVQGLVVGGGPSSEGLVREARERFGADYSVRYSSTESGGVGTLTHFDAPDSETFTSVGRPRPGIDLVIRDPETNEDRLTGEVGRICLRSPAVMDRYWNDAESTAAALDPDGWLRTDDLGWLGDDGCLRIAGRVADDFRRSGFGTIPFDADSLHFAGGVGAR